MDSERRNSFGSKESIDSQRRNSKDNTEYVPTRCRITKPTPPKPATNPMQFVKIGPCELYRKAQEQLKKVEEVKSVRQEIRDDAEDWQANLDNWKSSRRKRQEHIIERVVEVKKFEQQEIDKGRRKSKTFNEILEERNKRKNKASISLYENDDPNDLSDYGLGGSRNSNEIGTSMDDISHVENDHVNNVIRSSQSQQENDGESNSTIEGIHHECKGMENQNNNEIEKMNDNSINLNETENDAELLHKRNEITKKNSWNESYKQEIENIQPEPEQYTYESAIQGYRTRVISKTNLNPSLSLTSYKTDNQINESNPDVSVIVPKGSILKRKELFENDKVCELNHFESTTSRRLSGDFIHSQSLKERLLSLEKYTEQPLVTADNKYSNSDSTDVKNNNNNTSKLSVDQFVRNRVSLLNNRSESDSGPGLDLGSGSCPDSDECDDKIKSKSMICNNWSSSPEPDEFVHNKLDMHRSLDNLTNTTNNESIPLDRVQSLECLDYCHSNYPASNSSTELLVLSSQYGDTDREDSGIHTADVSCSVSQADEPVEDADIRFTAVVNISTEKSVVNDEYSCGLVDIIVHAPNRSPMNTEIYPIGFDEDFPLGPPVTALEPPKEKPPPPPIIDADIDLSDESELKRLNSTKRIKKEMRMKRSSFLGIDPDDHDQPEVEPSIRKPPDINSFLQKESRLEKQLYKKTQSSYSEAGDSQDSGVELERGRLSSDTWCSSLADSAVATGVIHSRQNSEPCTTNSLTSEEDEITKKEREIIELVEKEEKWRDTNEYPLCTNFNNIEQTHRNQNLDLNKNSSNHIKHESVVADYVNSEDDEHSEVLRVEHELLQLEREEQERQREKLAFRENRGRMHSKTCLKNKRLSLEDISGTVPQPHPYVYQTDCMDYRKSMPELQREIPVPKYNSRAQSSNLISRSTHVSPVKQPYPQPRLPTRDSYDRDDMYQHNPIKAAHPITRHSLQMLSAAPRSRLIPQDNWIHPKPTVADARDKFHYNQHWLIQEAEQRRLSEQPKYTAPVSATTIASPPPPLVQSWKLAKSEKHLPDAIIQTLTQRVQNKINISDRNILSRRMDNVQPGHYGSHSPHSVGHALPIHHPHLMMEESQDKMLSVSGKKKCSYCGSELGRGAAMIIESLCLFYHMDCFKCCVCHVQLGDGLMGTDVRVRNNKLHCHNCYSSDDGVKFSCV